MGHVEKLDLRFLQNKTETFLVSVTHLILRFAIVQNRFQQRNKTKINHINDNHIKFDVSLHFGGIWPTVCQPATARPRVAADVVALCGVTPRARRGGTYPAALAFNEVGVWPLCSLLH